MHRENQVVRWHRGITLRFIRVCCAMALGLMALQQVQAQDAPVHDVIKIGMSTALTGPAADLGCNVRMGVATALQEYNAQGKHPCELVVMDDAYEPSKTIPNLRHLIQKDKVLAIVGNVGTPTAVVALPIVRQENICFYGAYTGAGILRRQPPDPEIYNYRASYAQETAAMVDALLTHGRIDPAQIAFFTQRDAYGDAGYQGAINALKAHGFVHVNKLVHTRYDRNSLCVENAVAQILMADIQPRAIIMVGAYSSCGKFIRLARENGIKALLLNVSFVGTEPLILALGPLSENVIITQVVPHPESDIPAVKAYRQAMKRYVPEASPNFGSLEGYLSTVIFCKALERIDGQVTRTNILEALQDLGHFDIGLGIDMTFNASEHQASHTIWPTIIRHQQAQPLDWAELSTLCQQADSEVSHE
jgi:ABC-type branched-subunit amino acid transport system substrate-binding protein